VCVAYALYYIIVSGLDVKLKYSTTWDWDPLYELKMTKYNVYNVSNVTSKKKG